MRSIACRCDYCRGFRLMRVAVITHPDGKVTRELACPVCETRTPFGVCCPKCGDCRLAVVRTRHRLDQTIRVRKCSHCAHRCRTRELVESSAV